MSLLVLIVTVYSSSFKGTWHYDDYANIVNNKNIHMDGITLDAVTKTIYKPSQISTRKKIQRPLSYFTFALNYYSGGLDPFGYHLTNLAIHYFAAVFLFLFIKKTLLLPVIQERYRKWAYPIALISSVFWAVHPINVTAVTYIVQRMASMAGLFYIMSLYVYAIARTHGNRKKAVGFYCLFGILSVSALCTKENAAMLPVVIWVYEIFLVQGVGKINISRDIKIGVAACVVVMVMGFLYTNPLTLFNGFDHRPFTPFERVLTESRVIWYYISLLVYPLLSRVTLLHDVAISTSLITPVTTFLSLGCILTMMAWAIVIASKRHPFIGFCVLFYFLNHAIEGSFLSLELVYEHRNYLPSMLFWPPLAIWFMEVIEYFSYKKVLQFSVVMAGVLLIAANCHTTYAYSRVFKSGISLWSDNVKKSPDLSIVHNNLGDRLWKTGKGEMAYEHFNKALELDHYVNLIQKGIVHYNVGLYFLEWEDNVNKALFYLNKAMAIAPGYREIWVEKAKALMLDGRKDEARKLLKKAVSQWPDDHEIRNNYGVVLLKNKHFAEALEQISEARKLNDEATEPMAVMAEMLRQQDRFDEAIDLWEQYMAKKPLDHLGALALAELYHKVNNVEKAESNLGRLLVLKGEHTFKQMIGTALKHRAIKAYVPDETLLLSIIDQVLIRSRDNLTI